MVTPVVWSVTHHHVFLAYSSYNKWIEHEPILDAGVEYGANCNYPSLPSKMLQNMEEKGNQISVLIIFISNLILSCKNKPAIIVLKET